MTRHGKNPVVHSGRLILVLVVVSFLANLTCGNEQSGDDAGDETIADIPTLTDIRYETETIVDTSDIDVETVEPCKFQGEFPAGCACKMDNDCMSKHCRRTPDLQGMVCTGECKEDIECADDEACNPGQTVDEPGSCVPVFPGACLPCDDSGKYGCAPWMFCTPLGESGTFCLGECEHQGDCPENYHCSLISDCNGAEWCGGRQDISLCKPLWAHGSGDGVCPCSDEAAELGNINLSGCEGRYLDVDQDGYGSSQFPVQCVCLSGDSQKDPIHKFTSENNTDCDDSAFLVHPDAVELCNEIDDDCNGQTDDGYEVGNACDASTDNDKCKNGIFVCNSIGDGVTCENDSTENTVEVCDGIDNDCDQYTDEGFLFQGLSIGADCEGTGECGPG